MKLFIDGGFREIYKQGGKSVKGKKINHGTSGIVDKVVVSEIKDNLPKLVIMVDCGSTSNEAIDYLNKQKTLQKLILICMIIKEKGSTLHNQGNDIKNI